MIYTRLNHAERYCSISEEMATALKYLMETDFSKVEDSSHIEIDGNRVFAMVMSYETKAKNDTPEAHRKYIDIQYLIEGHEKIGFGPLDMMDEEVEGKPENDIWFYHGPMDYITIGDGRLAIFFPEDAHAPGIATDAPTPARKCVVKVLAQN